MAFNLAKMAKLETDPLRRGVLMNLLRKGPILEMLPFENVESLTSVAVRWTNLPSVSFRKVNEGYTPSEGDYEQVTESVYGFGGDIEFDRVFGKVKNTIVDPKTDQTLQKTTAMALTFMDYFVNGDHATDEDGFEGLKKRVANMPARQTVSASGTTDVLDPTATAADARKFLDRWEEAYYKANGGDVDVIVMNLGLKWGFGRVLRFLGVNGGPLFDTARDMFDREVLTYKGAQFVDAGLKTDQATEIIPNTEDPGDGGNDATSAYFVPFDIEQGVVGIQLTDPEIYDPLSGGERESKPTSLLRIDWWVGLASFGSFGPTRLKNVEDPANWT